MGPKLFTSSEELVVGDDSGSKRVELVSLVSESNSPHLQHTSSFFHSRALNY